MTRDVTATRELHVLIADDQPDVLRALRDSIAGPADDPPQLRISLAETGSHAVATLEDEAVDIAVLDVRMADGGAELVTTVRSRWPRTTIVSTSTHTGQRERMLAAGASYFVEKSRVAELVRQVIEAGTHST